jgi:YqaJ-like viral recombinase domain
VERSEEEGDHRREKEGGVMAFTVVECEQRSREWFAARVGLLTASDAAAMLSRSKKSGEETAGRVELRLRLALESLRGVPLEENGYESEYMKRGRAREADGLSLYEAVTGEIVQVVGFLRHDTLPIGCSPDAIVGAFEGGVELKSPKFTTHFDYLRKGTLPTEYAAQVMHSLFVTDLPFWDFCSYCEEFDGPARLFRVRVWRDDVDLDAYALAFSLFWGEVETVKDVVRNLTQSTTAAYPRELQHG